MIGRSTGRNSHEKGYELEKAALQARKSKSPTKYATLAEAIIVQKTPFTERVTCKCGAVLKIKALRKPYLCANCRVQHNPCHLCKGSGTCHRSRSLPCKYTGDAYESVHVVYERGT